MHPYQRQIDGLPSGDGGKSLWALYQDLLYAVLYVDRHPFTAPGQPSYPIKDRANFAAWVPPLPKAAALAIYGGQPDTRLGERLNLGVPRIHRALNYIRGQGGKVPTLPGERLALVCMGAPTPAVEAIYDMAHGWNRWTNPLHYTDQREQADAIGKAAAFASEFTRGRLRQLGVAQGKDTGATAARRTIGQLAAGGVISEAQAADVADAVNNGADSGRLALMLGATAVGVGAVAWLVS
jgi:hypothetical protein